MANHQDRVRIWNSFFKLAWREAKDIFELSNNCRSAETFDPAGGVLPSEEFHVLAAVVLCNLAIEARANHLIEELFEAGNISKEVARAARRLPPREKWFLIPTLAGSDVKLSADSGPHQAVAQLCELRNDVVHVDYTRLHGKLPKPNAMLSHFERFVEAMEDMNVILKRADRDGPLPQVISLGKFECAKG